MDASLPGLRSGGQGPSANARAPAVRFFTLEPLPILIPLNLHRDGLEPLRHAAGRGLLIRSDRSTVGWSGVSRVSNVARTRPMPLEEPQTVLCTRPSDSWFRVGTPDGDELTAQICRPCPA